MQATITCLFCWPRCQKEQGGAGKNVEATDLANVPRGQGGVKSEETGGVRKVDDTSLRSSGTAVCSVWAWTARCYNTWEGEDGARAYVASDSRKWIQRCHTPRQRRGYRRLPSVAADYGAIVEAPWRRLPHHEHTFTHAGIQTHSTPFTHASQQRRTNAAARTSAWLQL